jgi:hypothetical protein
MNAIENELDANSYAEIVVIVLQSFSLQELRKRYCMLISAGW